MAYYMLYETCSSNKGDEKLVDAITKLKKIDSQDLAVVSDFGINLQKTVREIGITPENPQFDHNIKMIFHIFDTLRITKAVRNNQLRHSGF